ncbi:hypothetical protein DH2020_028932 [Rehmannia glutinosa]|uniref:Protein S-acyltransferase n=1 Tax=Rehmannia glutinosa TaxID=99300 RepID=A0ABR0VRR6_REHGL
MDFANSGSPSSSSANYDDVKGDENHLPSANVDIETNCWGCGLRVLVSPHASVFKCGCYFHGVFHVTLAVILSISTLFSFCLAAFRPAGTPPMILWGSYPTVGKGGLENYTFCHYCTKPKSPRAHHCRSFVSTLYVAIVTSYSALYIWPPLDYRPVSRFSGFVNSEFMFRVLKEKILSFLRSAVFLPVRGLVLVYLFIASVSVGIGLSVLLWQQLSYIYVGKTYLSHLSAVDSEEMMERDCQNLVRFFGCPYSTTVYLPSYWKSRKSHNK